MAAASRARSLARSLAQAGGAGLAEGEVESPLSEEDVVHAELAQAVALGAPSLVPHAQRDGVVGPDVAHLRVLAEAGGRRGLAHHTPAGAAGAKWAG